MKQIEKNYKCFFHRETKMLRTKTQVDECVRKQLQNIPEKEVGNSKLSMERFSNFSIEKIFFSKKNMGCVSPLCIMTSVNMKRLLNTLKTPNQNQMLPHR